MTAILSGSALARRIAALSSSYYWLFVLEAQKALLADASANPEARTLNLQRIERNMALDKQRIAAFAAYKDVIPTLQPATSWLRLVCRHVRSDADATDRAKIRWALEQLCTAHEQMLERQAAEKRANAELEEQRKTIVVRNRLPIRLASRHGYSTWVRAITTPLAAAATAADRARLQTAINQTEAVRYQVLQRRHTVRRLVPVTA